MLLSDVCVSDVCLSVAYIGPISRTERPRKTKIGTEVAHVTRDSDTTFKVKRSNVKVTRPLWLVLLAGQHGHTVMVTYAGRSGPAVACLTAVREVLGSNRTVGSGVYRTAIYSLGHGLCAPFLQCLGQLSLLPSVGR